MTIRYFAVATLRTAGPSNSVRGEFLLEFTGADAGSARVWNAARRCWTNRIVNILDESQVADWRLAHHGDLTRFANKYAGAIG